MNDIDRSLSIRLYDVMDKVGVSEKIRKLHQEIAIRIEIIFSIQKIIDGDPIKMYIFGSQSKSSSTLEFNSDVDRVYCSNSHVIDDIQTTPPRDWSYLIVGDNHIYPGYVKLQLVQNRTPSTVFNTMILNTELANNFDADNEGRICLKHVTMCKYSHNNHFHERHGPSEADPGQAGCADQDHVFALRCRTIPKYAQTWLYRRRQYNWPSRGNLQKMSDLGCFFVGVGHSASREQQIEWRMSFSLQERLLMFSINPTQHKCYVLLKIIKNDIIKAEIGESISSYHCKTCLFYAIEVTKPVIWRPKNLMCCVRLCLMILLTWVVNGVCPNYFFPSENMFEKPQFYANRNRLLDLLKVIIAEERAIILRLQCCDIRNRILKPGIVQNNMPNSEVYNNYVNCYSEINSFSKDIYILAMDCSVTCQSIIKFLAQCIEDLKHMRVIDGHTEQQSGDAISFVIPVLHQHIAQRLASFVFKYHGHEYGRQLLYLSICHFQLGNRAHLMTSRLLVVSLLLRLEKYDLCEIILEDIEHDLKRYVVTYCGCYARGYVENIILKKHLGTKNVSCKTAIRTVFVGCVRFARSDTDIAPLPLQYEMYRSMATPPGSRDNRKDKWFDLATVDEKGFLYFLQYLLYSRLSMPAKKQAAIDNLVWVISDDPNLKHKETAYNLLGWIHLQEGRISKALRCFLVSWKIRPVHNAAKLHLCIALYKYHTR